MKTLQHAMDRTLSKLPEHILSELLAQKLAAHGVSLSPRDRKSLAKRVLASDGKYAHQNWKWWERRQIHVELTAVDVEHISRKVKDFTENGCRC